MCIYDIILYIFILYHDQKMMNMYELDIKYNNNFKPQ